MDIEFYKKEFLKLLDMKAKVIVYEDEEVNGLLYNNVEKVKYVDVPCSFAFNNRKFKTNLATQDLFAKTSSTLVIYMPINYTIPINSKIIIENNGFVFEYKLTASPNIYDTHQEILVLREDYV